MKGFIIVLVLFFTATFIIAETGMTTTIQQTKDKYQAELMALPGVVSIGIGLSTEGEMVIKIGLDGKHPDTIDKLPKELNGYQVLYQTVGTIKAQ